jgi:hypothetical protein
LKVGRKIVPFCNESERAIRAIEGEFGWERDESVEGVEPWFAHKNRTAPLIFNTPESTDPTP